MTDEDLAAIQARVDAATAGPWEAHHESAASGVFAPAPVTTLSVHGQKRIALVGSLMDGGNHAHDAAFMAHAREDVPALLAEVEQMREIVRAVAEGLIGGAGGWRDDGLCRCGPDLLDVEEHYVWVHRPGCRILQARTLLHPQALSATSSTATASE